MTCLGFNELARRELACAVCCSTFFMRGETLGKKLRGAFNSSRAGVERESSRNVSLAVVAAAPPVSSPAPGRRTIRVVVWAYIRMTAEMPVGLSKAEKASESGQPRFLCTYRFRCIPAPRQSLGGCSPSLQNPQRLPRCERPDDRASMVITTTAVLRDL